MTTGHRHALLVEALRAYSRATVFNPWLEVDELDVTSYAADLRVELLLRHLRRRPRFLLIGEAPGYQGCHFSGVPFTSERLIGEGAIPDIFVHRLTKRERPWSEPSATIVWKALWSLRIARETVLWNAFAWHPHRDGNRLTNRRPTQKEQSAAAPVLRAVIDLYPDAKIIAVGRVAQACVASVMGTAPDVVRHPANGGAVAFRVGIEAIIKGEQ